MTQISGKVIHGDHFGRTLGFPTANLDRRSYAARKLKIRLGIWAGTALLNRKTYKAGIVIGPLDKHGLPKIEAHLIGFKGNLYGKKISLEIKKYLRPFKEYKNIAVLKLQIRTDLVKINKLL